MSKNACNKSKSARVTEKAAADAQRPMVVEAAKQMSAADVSLVGRLWDTDLVVMDPQRGIAGRLLLSAAIINGVPKLGIGVEIATDPDCPVTGFDPLDTIDLSEVEAEVTFLKGVQDAKAKQE